MSSTSALAASARDLREGGSWGKLQRVKNTLIRWTLRAVLWVADRLPARWLLGSLGLLGQLGYWISPGLRRRARQNLEVAGLDPSLARRVFRNAGRNLGHCLLLRRAGSVESKVQVDATSQRALRGALAGGRGVVFVSLHLGPFELVAARISELCASWASRPGSPSLAGPAAGAQRPAIVVRESYDPALDPLVDAHRAARGLEVIHRGKPHSARKILRALKQGRAVGFLPDLGGRVRCVPAELFGQQVSLPIGPQRIAERTGAALLFGFLIPLESGPGGVERFTLRISAIPPSEAETRVGARSYSDSSIAQALEDAITQCPEHWLWMARDLVSETQPS